MAALLGAAALCFAPSAFADRGRDDAARNASAQQTQRENTAQYGAQSDRHRMQAQQGDQQGQWKEGHKSSGTVQQVADAADFKTVDDFQGKPIHGRDGEKLGDVHDFLLDPSSGKIKGVVVSTGGLLGIGDTLRVIEADGLQMTGQDQLTAQIDRASFEAQRTVEEEQLDRGDMLTSESWNRPTDSPTAGATTGTTGPAVASGATGNNPGTTSNDDAVTASASVRADADPLDVDVSGNVDGGEEKNPIGYRFVRATQLEGKALTRGDRNVGEIDQIVIDLEQGQAQALIDPQQEFAGQDADYLVPFDKLEIGAGSDRIGTTLARSDFGAAATASTEESRDWQRDDVSRDRAQATDENLAPTGRTTSEQRTAGDMSMSGAAQEIRAALDNDPSLARENIRVKTRIVLEGTASSEDAKEQAEQIAKRSAANAEVENKIEVQKR